MSNPIRILHVIRLMNHGGVESMLMNYYRNIDRTKIQFDFIQTSYEPAIYDEEITSLGGRIFRCPRYNIKRHFEYTNWWHSFLKEHACEYPIIHGHLASTAGIYLNIAKKYGCYAIAHGHSTRSNFLYQAFTYRTRYVADHFFACSKEAAISRYGKRIAKNNNHCNIVSNAIDAACFTYNKELRDQMRASMNIESDTLVVGHVGQFRREKNHKFLLNVFEEIQKTAPNSVLILIGGGPLKHQVESEVKRKNLEKSVIFTGPQDAVWRFYQAMDVFVMPSLFEGLPVTLVEAQAAGLPCVVSDTIPSECAITELVQFMSLKSSANNWCDQIVKHKSLPRQNTFEQIQAAGFDIKTASKWLSDYYENVVVGIKK